MKLIDGKVENYNDTVMDFFSEILELISIIRNVYKKTGDECIKLQFCAKENFVNVRENCFSEDVVRLFLLFYGNTGADEESIDICVDTCCMKYRKKSDRHFFVNNKVENDIRRIEKVNELLDCTFLDSETKEIIKGCLNDLIECLVKNKDEFFLWRKEAIFAYLNSYYEVLRLILCKDNVLETEGVREWLLIPMLQLGMDLNGDKESVQIRMTAPVVLSALNLIYDKLNQFALLEIEESIEEHIYKEIFLSKIHQIFRFYFVKDKNAELYHAAVAAYREQKMGDELVIIGRSLQSYNSFQGIRELRLADKILYEIDNRKYSDDLQQYNIVILGEIHYSPMRKLIDYLEKKIESKYRREYETYLKLNFVIYTKTLMENDSREIVSKHCVCDFYKYENELVNVEKLQNLLNAGDLFFILDNCDLYKNSVEALGDIIIFKQYVSLESYEEYYNRIESKDLILDCKFMDLYNVLNMYAWNGTLGFLKKRAKEDLIKYIQNAISSKPEKVAYIYISDIEAFKGLNCIQEHMVRIEKYNQKEIGIIRFANQKKEFLNVTFVPKERAGSNMRILVFNVWQFVKHVVLNYQVFFEEFILRDPENQFLDNIYVGLDYTDWKEKIEVSFYSQSQNEVNAENLERFLRTIFPKVFAKNGDMYQRYLKKAFVSFLFGAAKSIEDLVFLHIFKNKEDLMGELTYKNKEGGMFNSDIESYRNFNCKYSYKKMYWEAIEKIDRDNFGFFTRYAVLNLVESSKKSVSGFDEMQYIEHFFDNIIEATKNIGYTSSLLYANCLKETE